MTLFTGLLVPNTTGSDFADLPRVLAIGAGS